MALSPYEKSRAINYAIGTTSFKEANVAMIKTHYAQNMALSLEYEEDAIINGAQQRIIAKKTKGNQRYLIQSAPGETFYAGDIVECYGSTWIIIEVEANKDIYTTGIMLRCNHLFRWQNGTSDIIERWGVLDTGVYSTTVKDTETMTELNKQYKIYLPLDEDTRKLYIGKRLATSTMKDNNYNDALVCWRTTEFDDSSENYGDDALLIMKCISDQYNPQTDNIAEKICDYIAPGTTPSTPTAFNAVIEYSGDPIVRIGGAGKTFTVKYTNILGDSVPNVVTVWSLADSIFEDVDIIASDDSCRIVVGDSVPDGAKFVLIVEGTTRDVITKATVTVEAMGL